jgi:hypothetical protein
MPTKDFLKTDVKIFLDEKEVANFDFTEAPIIAADEAQSAEVIKLYDSFEGTITLTRKQAKRMLRVFRKAERRYRWKQFFQAVKNIFKGGV